MIITFSFPSSSSFTVVRLFFLFLGKEENTHKFSEFNQNKKQTVVIITPSYPPFLKATCPIYKCYPLKIHGWFTTIPLKPDHTIIKIYPSFSNKKFIFSIVGSAYNGTGGFRIYKSEAIKETVNHTCSSANVELLKISSSTL